MDCVDFEQHRLMRKQLSRHAASGGVGDRSDDGAARPHRVLRAPPAVR